MYSVFGGYPNSANKNKPNVFHSKDYHRVHDNQYLLSLAISVRTRVKTFSRCRLGDQHIQEFFRDRFMNLSNVPTSAAAPNLPFVPTWTMPGGMQIPPWMQAGWGAPQFQESAGWPPAAAPNAPPAPVPAVVLANQNAQAPAAAAAAAGEVVQDSHGFPDDRKHLHKDSKVLGMAWQVGDRRRCTSKKFRASCISVCDPGEWPMLKLKALSEEQTDFLLYVATGVLPNTNPHSSIKGAFRTAMKIQYKTRMEKNPSRLSALSKKLDNLAQCAFRMGYPYELCSPQIKRVFNIMRQGPQINVSWSPQPCMPGSMLQLENGECDSSGGPAAKAAMAETTRAVPEDEVRQQAQRQELTPSTRLQLPALEMPAGFHPSPPSAKRSRRSGNAAGGAGSPLAIAFADRETETSPQGSTSAGENGEAANDTTNTAAVTLWWC